MVFTQECLQRLQQRVRVLSSRGSPSDPVTHPDGFPLLCVNPVVHISERSQGASSGDAALFGTSPLIDSHFLHELGGTSSHEAAAAISSRTGGCPDISVWPNYVTVLQDDGCDAMPMQVQGDTQPPLHDEGISYCLLDSGPSRAEVRQWEQFLDHVGVWA